MRLLFTIDTKDYNIKGKLLVRPAVRSIIIKNNKVAMMHSIKYNYYVFPGGRIERNESQMDTLYRETLEETGLSIDMNTIKEYGRVYCIQKRNKEDADVFIQDNFYYLCDVLNEDIKPQDLDPYEMEEKYTLEFVDPDFAININKTLTHGPKPISMLDRDCGVLEFLKKEKYIK